MKQANQTERTLESGVPSHKAYAMSGTLPGANTDFGVPSLESMSESSDKAKLEKRNSARHTSDRGRANTGPTGVQGYSAQADTDHGAGGKSTG